MTRLVKGWNVFLAAFIDYGSLYLETVLGPAAVYYVVKLGGSNLQNKPLRNQLINQMMLASCGSLAAVYVAYSTSPRISAWLTKPGSFFILMMALAFLPSLFLPIVRESRLLVLVGVAATVISIGVMLSEVL